MYVTREFIEKITSDQATV